MKKLFQHQLLTKGLFALAVVLALGGAGIAFAATNDNSGNAQPGYGNGQQATAAADEFAASINSANSQFGSQVGQLSVTAKSQLQNGGGSNVDNFDAQFVAASDDYTNSLNAAFATFYNQVQNAANTAQSKDQFIDAFNHAKADYLNSLDAAKNQLADKLNKLGDHDNQVKDQFMNGFNSDRDAYGNKLEQAKNTFAATVSNLQ